MILRSLRMVHVRGLPEVRVTEAPERGVVRVPFPPDAPDDTLVVALRFLLTGAAADLAPAPGGGPGFAFVEAGLRTAGGEDFSLFRGIDRRGASQVSLREGDGRRVTGGHGPVGARLDELLGGTVAAWCERSLGLPVPDGAAPGARPRPAADAAALAAGEESSRAARRAVQELRHSLRAERLRLLASRRHAELLQHGRRLRHERGRVARDVDHESAERDRVRTRLRRVNEYRDQLARGASVDADDPTGAADGASERPASPSRPLTTRGARVEHGLIACAACTFAALVLYSTAVGDDTTLTIQIGLGLGFAVAVASYLHVASQQHAPPSSEARAAAPRDDARAWRESLRRRFADLGDPDAPDLPGELRRRLSELDARLAPLHARLERLDDAIAVFDVEAGRAARALHETLPEAGPGVDGLPEGADVATAIATVHELGDAVYSAVVERDALLAEGAALPGEARQALAVALDAMTDRIGAPGAVAALLRRVDSFACAVGEEPEEDQLADLLDAEIVRIEAEPPVWEELDAGTAGAPPDAHDGLVVLACAPPDLSDDDLVGRLGDGAQIVVGTTTAAADGGDRLRRPGTSRRPR